MFMLLAIPVGIAAGFLVGGRLDGLLHLRFRWAALAVAGLLVQVLLFTPAINRVAGALEGPIYLGSTAAVFVAVIRNLRLPGMAIAAAGALCNLVAIAANGGSMPASAEALALAGFDGPGEHTNSVVLANPAFAPLTDIFAIPAGVPFANVFSVGDVLIGVGVAVTIVAAMRRRAPAPDQPAAESSGASVASS